MENSSSPRRRQFIKSATCVSIGSAAGLLPLAVKGQPKPIRIGVIPNLSARVIVQQYEPLQAFLTRSLNVSVDVGTAPDWIAYYKRIRDGEFDVIVSAANVARLAQTDHNFVPIASYIPRIKGLFIVAKDQAEDRIPQLLKGKRIALANPASLVAFEGERWLDEKFRVKSGQDVELSRVRAEDSVGLSVQRGDAAAGLLSMGEFMAHPESIRSQLKVHTVFGEFTGFFVMASRSLMETTSGNNLVRALSGFSESSAEGKAFFERTGLKISTQVDATELVKMDPFVEKTRRLLA
jgi:phosphonate transport system substrate-binding protein